jgi:spore coat polysaccharide biosynthesis predicted glycosyltransferase SpsG/RimJ/RimL family protein N-acetyltransferase
VRVVVLCDGGGSIGVGHVMRSLALAEEAVAAGHQVVVAGHFEGSFLQGQLAAAPVEVAPFEAHVPDVGQEPPMELIELIQRFRPDVLHVDSYELHGWLMASMVRSNMEDGTFGRRPADVVVDPTFGAELSARPEDGSTWLLRGSRYTPVRQRVMDARRRRVDDSEGHVARTVLVVMGGTDPVGLTPAVVELLARTGLALEVTVIAVGRNADRVRAAARGSRLSLNLLVPVDDLPAIMARQDLVISAAGTSVWELCCIGVPMAVVWAVDNQREGYDRVVGAGAAVGLGGPEQAADKRALGLLTRALTDSEVRADLVLAGRHIVDGLGAWRVVRTWEQASRQALLLGRSAPTVSDVALVARPAGMPDARLLWEWRNDPVTRAGSRSSTEVSWDDHLRWLAASLARTDRMLLVVEDPVNTAGGVEAVGTVRWDREREHGGEHGPERGREHGREHEWEVSVTVAPERRGQSLARPILRAGEETLSEVTRSSGTDVTAYLAVVHTDNRASLRLFETSAYVPDLPPDSQGFLRFRKTARVP